jgi:hypothetical protein
MQTPAYLTTIVQTAKRFLIMRSRMRSNPISKQASDNLVRLPAHLPYILDL